MNDDLDDDFYDDSLPCACCSCCGCMCDNLVICDGREGCGGLIDEFDQCYDCLMGIYCCCTCEPEDDCS